MRTIAEVAEDIKSILNNIERTEECTGETLVDINELVDEILSIDSIERKDVEDAKRLFNKIYRNDGFFSEDIKLFKTIEKALGFKLFFWQKTFLATGYFRQTGETTAKCLKQLFGNTPIDYSERPRNKKEEFERYQLMQIKEQLQRAGVETAPIFTRKKDVRAYRNRVEITPRLTIDEARIMFPYKKKEDEE